MNPCEANCRTAISRAYYYLYHETVNHLKACNKYHKPRNKTYHKYVLETLNSFDIQLGNKYASFLDLRVDADYFLQKKFPDYHKVMTHIKKIDQLVKSIKAQIT